MCGSGCSDCHALTLQWVHQRCYGTTFTAACSHQERHRHRYHRTHSIKRFHCSYLQSCLIHILRGCLHDLLHPSAHSSKPTSTQPNLHHKHGPLYTPGRTTRAPCRLPSSSAFRPNRLSPQSHRPGRHASTAGLSSEGQAGSFPVHPRLQRPVRQVRGCWNIDLKPHEGRQDPAEEEGSASANGMSHLRHDQGHQTQLQIIGRCGSLRTLQEHMQHVHLKADQDQNRRTPTHRRPSPVHVPGLRNNTRPHSPKENPLTRPLLNVSPPPSTQTTH